MTNLTDEQIKGLVPHGVARLDVSEEWVVRTNDADYPATFKQEAYLRGNYLSPAQVADRVLRCECDEGHVFADSYEGEWIDCPECSSLRTLLLKLAGEGNQ